METLGLIRCCRILCGWRRPLQNLSFDGGLKVQSAARVTFGQFYSLCHPKIGINRVNRGYKKTNKQKAKTSGTKQNKNANDGICDIPERLRIFNVKFLNTHTHPSYLGLEHCL